MRKSISLLVCAAIFSALPIGCGGGGGNTTAPPSRDAATPTDCKPGDRQCKGKIPETCDADGAWQDGTTCQYICTNGACSGECTSGDKRCEGKTPQTCDANGTWQYGTPCPYVCQNGVCSGECVPDDQRCTGLVPQTCDADGAWQSGTACQYICTKGACTGTCAPGSTQCIGRTPETCDADGIWQDEAICPYVCQNGVCSGECVPDTKQCDGLVPQTCDADGVWQSGTACPFVCLNGQCAGVCTPDDVQCKGLIPEACDANGIWQDGTICPYVCQNGVCSGECVPDDQRCTGLVPQTCDADGAWQSGTACQYVCTNGACSGVCVPGSKQCDGNSTHVCDQFGQWSDQACSGNTPTCCNGSCTASIVEVKVGRYHTCARKNDGTVWCLGKSDYGELGDGAIDGQSCGTAPEKCRLAPVQVSALGSEVIGMDIGDDYTCALKNDGTLWCWGYNGYGQLGNGVSGPYEASPVQVSGLGTEVAEVAAGSDHACARKNDGTVWCWGEGLFGQLGDGTLSTLRTSPGQVTALNSNTIHLRAGNGSACVIKNDGTLWCWGKDDWGQLGTTNGQTCGFSTCLPSPVKIIGMGVNAVDVSIGNGYTCARKNDGTLWCWGFNGSGELGNGTITGPDCYGYSSVSPVQVSTLGSFVEKITVSSDFSYAIKTDGSVWAWGSNHYGVLGDGTTSGQACWNGGSCKPTPTKSTLLGDGVLSIHSTSLSSCAVKNDGTLWCWGLNDYGQLGDGTMTDRLYPVRAMCQ